MESAACLIAIYLIAATACVIFMPNVNAGTAIRMRLVVNQGSRTTSGKAMRSGISERTSASIEHAVEQQPVTVLIAVGVLLIGRMTTPISMIGLMSKGDTAPTLRTTAHGVSNVIDSLINQ